MTRRGEGAANDLLDVALEAVVPLHMLEIRGRSPEWMRGEASRCATVVGSQGDALQYGGKGCAAAFNALARGLAVMALTADGGVTWRGLHWCSRTGCRQHLSDEVIDDRDAGPD